MKSLFLANMKKNILYTVLLFCSSLSVFANFDQNENMQKAYSYIINLEFDLGREYIEKERILNPENGLILLNENYIDFLTITIGEEKNYFEKWEYLKSERLQKLSKNDENSPYYFYSQAEINLQWAFSRLKFEEYFTAALELKSAYSLLKKNEQKFSEFDLNKKGLGVLYSLIGSIPDDYQWVVSLIGMEGGVNKGLTELDYLIEKSKTDSILEIYNTELLFLSTTLHLQLTENKNKFQSLLDEIDEDYKSHLLLTFAAARLSQKLGANKNTILILENKPTSDSYFQFSYLDYLLGMSKLYELDKTSKEYFVKFLDETKGDNYVKSAYQKMAWISILLEENNHKNYYKKVILEGTTFLESDKQALKEAKKGITPHPSLLKSRLLFDGGYYEKAEEILILLNPEKFKNTINVIEYWYRLGRVSQSLERDDKTIISLFNESYNIGKNSTLYYGAMSALQIAYVYLNAGNTIKAKEYFEKCLSMSDFDYEDGIKIKAKSALNNIDN